LYHNLGLEGGPNFRWQYKTIADCTNAIKLNPSEVSYYNKRGNTYFEKNQFDEAIIDYTKVIELNPRNARAYSQRGLPYFLKGEYDKAIDDFSKAIELNPDFAGAYYFRGMVQLHTQEWSKVKEDLNIAKDMGVNIVDTVPYIYRSVENCEQIIGVKLPEEIAALLMQP
ncbi:MAG: tetratricopeptide repeat protein, partial [Candidatus Poribacteria bacterium]|nr:tetratricopeptide repeat protein [Candidatus Poribacteria bacterium]